MLKIYIEKENGKWDLLSTLENKKFIHKRTINDIAWASLNGRSSHMIATGSKKGLYIWMLNHEKLKNIQ